MDHIFTNGQAPLHSHINHNTPQFLYSLWRRANARNVSSLIFHGGNSTFINSFDKTKYLLWEQIASYVYLELVSTETQSGSISFFEFSAALIILIIDSFLIFL